MAAAHKRYIGWMSACFAVTLLPILLLNLQLGRLTLGNADKVRQASAWQQATHGVTYAPTLSDTAIFKTLRLHDRLPEINGAVFGSSTAMGLSETALPPSVHIYNFAQTGHDLIPSIGEAEWLADHSDNIKYLFLPLDWAMGFLYAEGEPSPRSLDPAEIPASASTQEISLTERLRDALSYPRIANLFDILRTIAKAPDSLAAFRQYFFQAVSDDYRCADGTPAKDFDLIFRGTCTGFRYDGSATFANSDTVKDPRPLILSATTSNSKYVVNLTRHSGEPNPAALRHLAALARKAEAKGGKLVLFMPPLLPGLEEAFMKHPKLSVMLAHTKESLRNWSASENIQIIDAGQSERYGCAAAEFLDEHHAVSSCYNKIFSDFWKNLPHDRGAIQSPSFH